MRSAKTACRCSARRCDPTKRAAGSLTRACAGMEPSLTRHVPVFPFVPRGADGNPRTMRECRCTRVRCGRGVPWRHGGPATGTHGERLVCGRCCQARISAAGPRSRDTHHRVLRRADRRPRRVHRSAAPRRLPALRPGLGATTPTSVVTKRPNRPFGSQTTRQRGCRRSGPGLEKCRSGPGLEKWGRLSRVTESTPTTPPNEPAWQLRFRAARMTLPRWARLRPERSIFTSNASGTVEIYAWDRSRGTIHQLTKRPAGTYLRGDRSGR